MKRSLLASSAVATCVLVICAMVLTSQPASAARHANATLTVHGFAMNNDNHPQAGITVLIHAWPKQSVMEALEPGQKVPWVMVGSTKTESGGAFWLSLPASKLAGEATDGVVDLEADTMSAVYAFPVVISRNDGNAYMPTPQAIMLRPDGKKPVCDGAGWIFVKNLGRRWSTVGQTYVATSNATQKFTYLRGQSSSFGFGVSGNDKYGSFSEDGTSSWNSSIRENFHKVGANKSVWYQTQFRWGKYKCHPVAALGDVWAQRVNKFIGSARTVKPTAIPTTPKQFCAFEQGGTSQSSNNSAAVEWTGKLGVGVVLGFQASEQTGYDSSAQVTYDFSRNRHLCGQKDVPGGTPRQLVVRK